MAFHFSLAPVLRLRKSVERQRMLRFRAASLIAAQAAEQIAALDGYMNASLRADAEGLIAGRSAVEMHFAVASAKNLQEMRGELANQLRELELQRQHAAADYQDAYRQREALDNLRLRQQRAYEQQQLRRRQRELDEDYVLRHGGVTTRGHAR
jgi:flagellar export protein FliJ